MIRIQIDSKDEGEWTHQRMIAARQSLEELGERVELNYAEKFTPMQRTILFVIFISGSAFGAMIALMFGNNLG